jgi:hypothetical protein
MVSTGAELEPEANAHQKDQTDNAPSSPRARGSRVPISRKELGYLALTDLIIPNRSKRTRVPPTVFSMNAMGGQNEPLPPSHEEKVRQQAEIPSHLLLPSDDSEDDAPSKKRRKSAPTKGPSGLQQQRVRTKSLGHIAGDKGANAQTAGASGKSCPPKGDKIAPEDADVFGDIDMVCTSPGVSSATAGYTLQC